MADVIRGDKRKVLAVRIIADKETRYQEFGPPSGEMDRGAIIERLLGSGCWPFIRQRPFDVVADPAQEPRDIFISAFDTRPLAADLDLVVRNSGAELQAGLDVLAKLTKGRVHLGLKARPYRRPRVPGCQNVQRDTFKGHPAGNVGVRIHHHRSHQQRGGGLDHRCAGRDGDGLAVPHRPFRRHPHRGRDR